MSERVTHIDLGMAIVNFDRAARIVSLASNFVMDDRLLCGLPLIDDHLENIDALLSGAVAALQLVRTEMADLESRLCEHHNRVA